MDRKRTVEAALAGALFRRVQSRLLGFLFGQPDRAYHASEVIRLAQSGAGTVQRELKKYSAAGILPVTISGIRKLHQAKQAIPDLCGAILWTVAISHPK